MGNSTGTLRCVFRPTSSTIDLSGPTLSIGVWQMCTFTYNNVTARDLAEDLKYRRKVAMKKYPNLSLAEIELLLDSRRPEYH
jgi:hypothetical protein